MQAGRRRVDLLLLGQQFGLICRRRSGCRLVDLVKERRGMLGIADHLVGGDQLGKVGIAQKLRQLIALGQQILEHRLIVRPGAILEGQIHRLPGLGLGSRS